MKWHWAALVFLAVSARPAAAATVEIVAGDARIVYSQTQLLARPDLRTLTITDSVYRRRFTRFKAIPLANLLKGVPIPDFAVIQCNAVDGFSSVVQKTRLLPTDPGASRAFLAIEDPGRPWPNLEGKTHSAGPFYLVWIRPRASSIGPEEWPFNLASFTVLSDPRQVFPDVFPAADAAPTVQRGLRSFQKNCFACHRINGDGAGTLGPDLNLPANPTEYFGTHTLISLIRDPASVRSWPGMAMRGFPQDALPDAELADLIAYLKYMSSHKKSR